MTAPPWRHLPAQQGKDCGDEGDGYYYRRDQCGEVAAHGAFLPSNTPTLPLPYADPRNSSAL